MAKTFLRTKNVGSPWESFSIVSGNELQIRRTRCSCFKLMIASITAPDDLLNQPSRRQLDLQRLCAAPDRELMFRWLLERFVQHRQRQLRRRPLIDCQKYVACLKTG